MLSQLRSSAIPAALRQPALFDPLGLPRFGASIWTCFTPDDAANSTLVQRLGYIESLYEYADGLFGTGGLDDALIDTDVDTLGQVLEAYFISIRNQVEVKPISETRWQVALAFVRETLTRITRNAQTHAQFDQLDAKLRRLNILYSQLRVRRHRKVDRLRSLPASVVEALYEMLDPTGPTNPFKRDTSRWRVYVIFIALLHQGLRRGELLILPADAVKSAYEANSRRERLWINVTNNEYEDDPRYAPPSLKTPPSVRQIPVSELTAKIIDEYVSNYRGRPSHSFLMTSQKKKPLSTEGVTYIFQKITASLPRSVARELYDRTGKRSVKPHDLRHTCAVVRLNQFLTSGDSMETALQKMRAFFGWARSSDMPLKYARAVFEDRNATIWNNVFDDRVAVLRNIPRSS